MLLSDSLSIPESLVNKNVFPSLISEAAEPPSLGSGCKGARDCVVAGGERAFAICCPFKKRSVSICQRTMPTFPRQRPGWKHLGQPRLPAPSLSENGNIQIQQNTGDFFFLCGSVFTFLFFPLCNLSPALLSKNCGRAEFIFESPDCFYSSMNYLLHAVLLTQTST